MTTRADLHPLFDPTISLSSDQARAIVGALQDIAESDGLHDEEIALIAELVTEYNVELGDDVRVSKVSPAELGRKLVDPTLRKLAVQTGVMVAMADGSVSEIERARVLEFAVALGFDAKEYQAIEDTITSWIRSGNATPMFE
ncbi:MAG: tellurite resistance TerB family protein [Polyangiaceae bacterium]|nr:tellurite resistance TerB family protein [Polyangiaceae bacterium]